MDARCDFRILHDYPDAALEASWRACLTSGDVASHYAAPEFFLEPFFSEKRPFAILAIQQEHVIAALTGIHEGNHVVSGLPPRPQICFRKAADLVLAADALAQGLEAESVPAALVTVYTWAPSPSFAAHGFRCHQEEGVVLLNLEDGPEVLFRRFSSNRRLNIRKAIRIGVEVFQASTTEDFLAFYEIQREWTVKKGLPLVPLPVAERAFQLRGNRRLFLARFEGKIIAGIVLRFYPQGLIEYAANSSLEEFHFVKPNDILHWRAIQWAAAEGLRRYSLAAAHMFLRRFGGEVVPTYRYRADRTWLRRHDLREALLAGGRQAMLRLPRPVTEAARRLLRRQPPSGTGDSAERA